MAALKPDLIVAITAGLTREQYDAFARIAPTVAGPADAPDGAVAWQDATKLTGAALGLPGEADQLVRKVEDRFLEAEESHPELAGATVAAVRPSTDGRRVVHGVELAGSARPVPHGPRHAAPGRGRPAAGTGLYATLPADQLSTLDRADAIMVVGTEAERAAFAALPGYGQLNLVQQSKVVTLDDEQSAALSFGSVLSLPSVVDELSGRIARAIER